MKRHNISKNEVLKKIYSHLGIPLVFSGKILQTPPIFSAKRVQGKRAYELARKGENVELKSRPIDVTKLELILIPGDRLAFKINCSKGTYISYQKRPVNIT